MVTVTTGDGPKRSLSTSSAGNSSWLLGMRNGRVRLPVRDDAQSAILVLKRETKHKTVLGPYKFTSLWGGSGVHSKGREG